jgi:hypothetical protein
MIRPAPAINRLNGSSGNVRVVAEVVVLHDATSLRGTVEGSLLYEYDARVTPFASLRLPDLAHVNQLFKVTDSILPAKQIGLELSVCALRTIG